MMALGFSEYCAATRCDECAYQPGECAWAGLMSDVVIGGGHPAVSWVATEQERAAEAKKLRAAADREALRQESELFRLGTVIRKDFFRLFGSPPTACYSWQLKTGRVLDWGTSLPVAKKPISEVVNAGALNVFDVLGKEAYQISYLGKVPDIVAMVEAVGYHTSVSLWKGAYTVGYLNCRVGHEVHTYCASLVGDFSYWVARSNRVRAALLERLPLELRRDFPLEQPC